MKRILSITVLLLIFTLSDTKAQMLTPVTWGYSGKKISDSVAVVFLRATIDGGWHVYSQFVKGDGPVKTSFTFSPSEDYTLMGETTEPKPIIRMEKVFNVEVSFFERNVVFEQKIKLKKGQVVVKGFLEYMACNDQKNLPAVTEEFSIKVK